MVTWRASNRTLRGAKGELGLIPARADLMRTVSGALPPGMTHTFSALTALAMICSVFGNSHGEFSILLNSWTEIL